MPVRDEREIAQLLDGLVDQTVDDNRAAYMRRTVDPLTRAIRNASSDFEGEPDMRRLLAELPEVFFDMDPRPVTDSSAAMLTQGALIGRQTGTPDLPMIATTEGNNPFGDEVQLAQDLTALSIDVIERTHFVPRKESQLGALFGSKTPVGSRVFDTLRREQRARAFRIAGINKGRLIQKAQRVIELGLRDGVSNRDIQRQLIAIFADEGVEGLPNHHFTVLMRQNIHTTYNVSKQRQQYSPAVQAAFPYLQYLTVKDISVRPEHAALHGKIIRKDDPIWKRIYPPWGWNCRCTTRDVSEREVGRENNSKKRVDGTEILTDIPVEGTDVRGVTPDPDFDFPRDQLSLLDSISLRTMEGRLREIIERAIETGDRELAAQAIRN